MSAAAALSLEEFQTRVRHHLERALAAIPDCVPDDVFDKRATSMMDELSALDQLLFGLGADERDLEQQEQDRVHRTLARQKIPALEDIVMRIDHRVQSAVKILGTEARVHALVLPMHADMLAMALVQLLDHFPASAFKTDRVIPPGFAASEDATVDGIIALMRQRKDGGS